MAVTYPNNPPSDPEFSEVTFRLVSATGVSSSPYTYREQTYEFPGQRWEGELTLPGLGIVNARDWTGWLTSLRGRRGTFKVGDPGRTTPVGAATSDATVTETANPPYLSFDGTDDDVNFGSPSALDNLFSSGGTVSAWIYPKSAGEGGSFGRILDKRTGWSCFVLDESSGSMNMRFVHDFDSNDGGWTTDGRPIKANRWQHVSITYDKGATGNDPTIFINGSSAAIAENNSPSGTASDDSSNNMICGNNNAGSATFDGFIDDVRAWSNIRTSTEIQNNMHDHLGGGETGLVGYWKFDDGSGNASDSSSNSNTGTVNGATWVTNVANNQPNSIYVKGLSADTTDIIKRGDYVEVASQDELKKIVESVDSDAGGGAEFVFEPRKRTAPASGDTVKTQDPKGLFRLSTNQVEWNERALRHRMTLPVVEVINS